MSTRRQRQEKGIPREPFTPAPKTQLQRAAVNAASPDAVPPIVQDVLSSPGQALDAETRAFMEPRFGHDFSGVRVHTDEKAAESARAVNALAYTVGQDVVFDEGQYEPGSVEGQRLMAHELTHVMQQSAAAGSVGLPVIPPSHTSEVEADLASDSVQAGRQPDVTPVQPALQRQIVLILTERRRLASGSASPGPGITIRWSGASVSIVANLQISGEAASADVAAQIKSTIERNWNATFPDGYSVSCTANVTYRAPGASEDGGATQIEVLPGGSDATSYVRRSWLVGARFMRFYLSNNLDWVPAHEFGHLLGLDDRYSEGVVSRINTLIGRGSHRETTPEKGYENNLMAVDHGTLQSKNVQDLLNLYAYENVPVGMSPESVEA